MKAHAIVALLIACVAPSASLAQQQDVASQDTAPIPAAPPAFYHNLRYGFCFRLPWSYYVVNQTWSGTLLDTQKALTGPELLIRSRGWTQEDPWQDIPIMIFTPSQWKLIETGKLAVSAAPIGPSELGRTISYVFALPPRWIGFTDAEGQEAVEALMNQHPFQAPCEPIVYRNAQYDFCFRLPADWVGYKIFTDKWGTETESYPELTIRNPKWTLGDRWQDIPLMIFTPRQWKLVENGNLSVSPAPIVPGEMGRNSRYVFVLPPRWIGYADAEGQDELQPWMRESPLQAPCEKGVAQSAK